MKRPTAEQLLAENTELRARLEEIEQTLDAIRGGDVDAVVVSGPKGDQIFSLVGAESIYRLIVETMKEAAFTVAFDGTILFCNAQFGQFVQRPMEQIVGHRLHDFVAPDNVAAADSLLLVGGNQPVKQRLVLWDSREQRVPVHVSANVLHQPDGPSICLVAADLTELENSTDLIQQLRRQQAALRDSRIAALNLMKDAVETRQQMEQANENLRREITARMQAEEALREAHERAAWLARFPAENPAPVLRVSTDGTVLYCNPAAAELPGWACNIGGSPRELFLSLVRRAMTEGREVRQDVDFDETSYLVWAVPFPAEHYANLYGRDITDRKRAEEALREANEQLQAQTEELQTHAEELRASEETLRELNATLESKVAQRTAQLQQRARQLAKLTLEMSEAEDRERKRMAEILHDDLQQQLAAAKFQVSVLKSRARSDAAVQATAAEIDHMLKEAIEQSRSLSHELSPAVMHHGDLGETFRWLADQVQAKHGLVVSVDEHGEARSESEALKGFLFKAAQEFLFNAVKHARVNEVRLRVRRFGRYLYLSVSDCGRGFDPQGIREAAGFGLLNIRERVELLGGRMKIRSAPGEGSTFSLVVPDGKTVGVGPRACPTSATSDGNEGREDGHGGPPLRVLLADDHEIVREGLRSVLSEAHDVEVVGEAANGREAVDLAHRLRPDVIIMDVSMPLIEGDDATRQIKIFLPRTRVIALSMYSQPEKIEAMSRAGAEGYILKTAPSEELLAAIRGQMHAGVE